MIRIHHACENALIINLTNSLSPTLPARIQNICQTLENVLGDRVLELVPAYTSILLYYKLELVADVDKLKNVIYQTLKNLESNPSTSNKIITIPVYYDESVAPDLQHLANQKNLTAQQVIQIHSQTCYQVYAVGFSPAFAYLGMVDSRITMARLDNPRKKIAAGSVGIANQQTAVYPISSPAGWNIIGKTSLDLSLDNPDNLTKFNIGDQVKFKPINQHAFLKFGGKL